MSELKPKQKRQARIITLQAIYAHEFNGSDLKNAICSHPLKNMGFEHDVPMLEGDFVTLRVS